MNPALYAGHDTCSWKVVASFMRNVVVSPLPLRLVHHHLGEMCGPGPGENKAALLDKRERTALLQQMTMLDVIDFLDRTVDVKLGKTGGLSRIR